MDVGTAFEFIERALKDDDPVGRDLALDVLRLLRNGVERIVRTTNEMTFKIVGREGAAYLHREDELRSMAEEVSRGFANLHYKSWGQGQESCDGEPRILYGSGDDNVDIDVFRTNGTISGISRD